MITIFTEVSLSTNHNTSRNSTIHTSGFTSNGGLLEGSSLTPSGEASPTANNDSQTLAH